MPPTPSSSTTGSAAASVPHRPVTDLTVLRADADDYTTAVAHTTHQTVHASEHLVTVRHRRVHLQNGTLHDEDLTCTLEHLAPDTHRVTIANARHPDRPSPTAHREAETAKAHRG